MLIDIHTHLWEKKHITNDAFINDAKAVGITKNIIVDCKKHFEEELRYVDKAVVFGLNAKASGVKVPNEYISKYANEYPEKVIGYASVDPNDSEASQELEYCIKELNLKGLKLGPIYQNFDPHDEKLAYPVYEKAQNLDIPVMWHMGGSFIREGLLEYSRPYLIDRIAIDFPKLKMIIAHMAYPWENETIVIIRKQPNVYADIAVLCSRPMQLCNILVSAFEYNVTHKMLFGTDFPFTTIEQTIQGLKKIKSILQNEIFQEIPGKIVDDIIYKNNLNFLKI